MMEADPAKVCMALDSFVDAFIENDPDMSRTKDGVIGRQLVGS
jgi:hypothetical protein